MNIKHKAIALVKPGNEQAPEDWQETDIYYDGQQKFLEDLSPLASFRREIPRPFILPQAYISTLEESDKEEVVDQEGKSFPKEVSKLSTELST